MKKTVSFLVAALMLPVLSGCGGTPEPTTSKEEGPVYQYVTLGSTVFRIEEGTPLYFNGRWFDKEIGGETVKASTNNGAEVYFLVSGTESVTLRCPNNGNMENTTPVLAYCIDGSDFAPVRVSVEDDKAVIPLPDTNNHIVRVVTESRNAGGDKWNTGCGYAIAGVDAGSGTTTGLKPMNKTIAFYGDSITEGDFVLNLNWNLGSSGTYTYAWQAAKELHAVPYVCGYGSSGVMQDGFFKDALTAAQYMTNGVPDPGAEDPAVIVINHGANDQNYSDADVTAKYRAFVEFLHERHPNAVIVAFEAFGHFKKNAVEKAVEGLSYAHFVTTEGLKLSFTDGLHPNQAGAEKAGKYLAEKITELVGEDFFLYQA